MPIEYRAFTIHDAGIYAQQLALRDHHLHRPFGIPFLPEYHQNEERILHEGAFDGEDLIGTVVAKFFDSNHHLVPPPTASGIAHPQDHGIYATVGQMIVHPNYQGLGIGRELVLRIEAQIAGQGFTEVSLKARDKAIGFYEKLGYAGEGELFLFKTIPHLQMTKQLR